MIPILSPAQSAALDRESAGLGVPVEQLMESAGRSVARQTVALLGGAYGRRAVVVCGKGNNGGDGLVAARRLLAAGMGVSALLRADARADTGAAAANLAGFAESGGRVHAFTLEGLLREAARADIVLDAMFGTGFRGEPRGRFLDAIRAVNDSGRPTVAIDIPSGVEGDTGSIRGEAIQARLTVALSGLKPGLVFQPGASHAGRVVVADIGLAPQLVRANLWLAEEGDVSGLLPARDPEGHKRSVGTVLVVAGSRGMAGAAALAAASAYRAGAGLVTLAVPEGILRVVQQSLKEATFLGLPETSQGTASEDGWPALEKELESFDAVAIGPGLTTNRSTVELVGRLVAESRVPMVVDADGLNAFAGRAELLGQRKSEAVITPHAGELGRLRGMSPSEVVSDRVEHARKAAAEFGCVVLLKGSRTVVARPDGEATVNPTGGPALATAGTGDVLTGAIAAFLSRGVEPSRAAVVAAYAHGLAGQMAASELGQGTMASDVVRLLPHALQTLRAEA